MDEDISKQINGEMNELMIGRLNEKKQMNGWVDG